MKFSLLVLSLVIANTLASDLLQNEWNLFKTEHKKKYASAAEELGRFNIWINNADFIKKHNSEAALGKHSFTVRMNQFGDLTVREFSRMVNGYNNTMKINLPSNNNLFEYDPTVNVPDSIDWRTSGYVTDVKDQGQCGSCWAFSTTGSLEGQHFKASGKLVSLSEQNLVDCSTKYGNQGCNGGLMDQAFQYIKDNNGIDTEDSYPYEAVDQTCSFNPANIGATDTGFTDVKSKDESALKQAVGTVGPVSVAIDASHSSFQFYHTGVYHEILCSQTRLDHGVLAVGYGTQSGKDFWIVKNSWSTTWGDKGYILMSRNKNNNCGIATAASFPLV